MSLPTERRRSRSCEGGHVAAMQRRRLLNAFVEVQVQGGLESTGVGRICERAGVSRRTFYDHFADREACFLAAFDAAIEQLAQLAVPAYTGAGGWLERVRRALGCLLAELDRDPALARLCLIETVKGDARVLDRRRRAIEQLARAVDEGREQSRAASVPSPLMGESIVGGALSVIQTRLLDRAHARAQGGSPDAGGPDLALSRLAGPLMSMIVQPYLGAAAARRELERAARPGSAGSALERSGPDLDERSDPFCDLPIRFTYRTARVIDVIAQRPGANNRQIAQAAGASDQGQMSKLLRRLQRHDIIRNHGNGHPRGEPNAWRLTARGRAIHRAIGVSSPPVEQ